jgi:asparagine synthase (glutamine-hydrolysing)
MCGIFGIIRLNNKAKPFDIDLAKTAMLKMQHRGPDAHALTQLSDNVLLGHLRLSIIDLDETNNQPFSDASGRYHLTYNGEIYNYLEIKQTLCEIGYSFRTKGDTEVLLAAYMEWGRACVERFNGMWAFAIYDSQEKTLFCSRDRFGVKPFHYALHEDTFIFASEIKSIITYFTSLKTPNYNIISNFCRKSLGAQTEETWFVGVKRLLPSHHIFLSIKYDSIKYSSLSENIDIKRYWNYPTTQLNLSFEEASARYYELFVDAVRLRMRSDVPVGTTLSGGVDSPSIVATMRTFFDGEHNTYTAYSDASFYSDGDKYLFKENIDLSEKTIVQAINKQFGLTEHIVTIDYQDYTERLREIIYHLESPHPFTTVFPLSQLLKEAKRDVTVVLEGQGADELLGGYLPQILFYYLFDLLKKGKLKTAWKELQIFREDYDLKFAIVSFLRTLNINILQKTYAKIQGIDKLYKGALKDYTYVKDTPFDTPNFGESLNKILFEQHSGGLVNLLHYGDALSMQHSLESRLPFMDYRLVEFVFQLPSEFKIMNGYGKYIHRETLKHKVSMFGKRVKIGFHSPTTVLFKSNEANSPASILLSERCLNRGLFDEKTIRMMLKAVREGRGVYGAQLYRLLGVELWFREFMD